MIKAILIEALGALGFSSLGAYVLWNARREWLAENYWFAFWYGMLGVWFVGKLIWLSFV